LGIDQKSGPSPKKPRPGSPRPTQHEHGKSGSCEDRWARQAPKAPKFKSGMFFCLQWNRSRYSGWMQSSDRTEVTYHYERWRAVAGGILETAGSTFLLLIAVRWFEAGATAKALLVAGSSLGLLVTPLVVKLAETIHLPPARMIAHFFRAGAVSCGVVALFPWQPLFLIGGILCTGLSSAVVPLFTQIYQENYPEHRRGRLFARTVMIRIASAAIFCDLAGRLLALHMGWFRVLMLVFGLSYWVSAVWVLHYPSQLLQATGSANPLRSLRYVRTDRVFRQTLICWMLMGFANLMMYPMRVEYLANPKYGLALSVTLIALLTGVIPNLARLIMSPIWGWLFDRMNFFALRVALNVGFALGILTFFVSQDMWGLVLGGVVFGVSLAGGDVAWSLWVTKFAPPERVADYMSVHTFFTGVRGVIAPQVAFHVLHVISIAALGWISASMILVASLMLLPEIRWAQSSRPAVALVEEISD
jgi:MFS family permease